ncbi:MAG: hypothetical protein QOH20_2024, partial [Mycobacterium sp.]|nr:hypothetical protein [Mycobacterium sp.]
MFLLQIGLSELRTIGSVMGALRTVSVVSIIAVVAFGIAACGADQKSASTGPGGGDITITT